MSRWQIVSQDVIPVSTQEMERSVNRELVCSITVNNEQKNKTAAPFLEYIFSQSFSPSSVVIDAHVCSWPFSIFWNYRVVVPFIVFWKTLFLPSFAMELSAFLSWFFPMSFLKGATHNSNHGHKGGNQQGIVRATWPDPFGNSMHLSLAHKRTHACGACKA